MGALWMLVAGFLFGCMGVFVKFGAAYFSNTELVFYRAFSGIASIKPRFSISARSVGGQEVEDVGEKTKNVRKA